MLLMIRFLGSSQNSAPYHDITRRAQTRTVRILFKDNVNNIDIQEGSNALVLHINISHIYIVLFCISTIDLKYNNHRSHIYCIIVHVLLTLVSYNFNYHVHSTLSLGCMYA